MVDLQPLDGSDKFVDIMFERLLQGRLTTDQLVRAQGVYRQLRRYQPFRVANAIYLGTQKGNVEDVLAALEKWCGLVRFAPDPVVAGVDTRHLLDIVYQELFMGPTDTFGGFRFEKVQESGGASYMLLRSA